MKPRAGLVLVAVVFIACGGQSVSDGSAVSSSRTESSPSVLASAVQPGTLTGNYGMVIAAGRLELVGTDGRIAASAPMTQPSAISQGCGESAAAWTLPAVSASNSHVYFRDGDSKIRMLVPPSTAVDVTNVHGGPTSISGFSVSPDDQRIAVVVEELTGAGPSQEASISLRLYVENLRGGGSHADIYTATFPAGKPATMLWPMGWHQGHLVLALWAACTFESLPYPNAWHVVDASNAIRLASIGDNNCLPLVWPNPAGIDCFDYTTNQLRRYDWSGKLMATVPTAQDGVLSPSGLLIALPVGGGIGDPSPTTTIQYVDGRDAVTTPGHMACLWIDESHLLAPDAVIAYPSGAVISLRVAGQCAGRFPGGL